jgi:hypothetical protein
VSGDRTRYGVRCPLGQFIILQSSFSFSPVV